MNDSEFITKLFQKKFWIFDMDGTLTVAAHDFAEIKRKLDLPQELDIIQGIENLPSEIAEKKLIELNEIELEIAKKSQLNPGVYELLTKLKSNDVFLGILTRNNRQNTKETLKSVQIDHFFQDDFILTREDCQPKPAPDGILILLDKTNLTEDLVVMVGDYIFDLEAGQKAGVQTAYFDPKSEFLFRNHSDFLISDFTNLLQEH
jgi:HAD superfamily hydrolase (TIGR01509 family)